MAYYKKMLSKVDWIQETWKNSLHYVSSSSLPTEWSYLAGQANSGHNPKA